LAQIYEVLSQTNIHDSKLQTPKKRLVSVNVRG